jgi:hypothetical protein
MKTFKILLIVVAVATLSSCNFDINLGQIDGDGNVTTETRIEGESFDEIKAAAGIEVFLTEGTETKVVIEADNNLHEIISATIENGKLTIKTEENIGRSKSKKAYVTYTSLKGIYASSGSEISSTSVLKSETLDLDASSGADIELEVFTKSLRAEASSGADIILSGTASNLDADASSGSDIDAKELLVVTCVAEASSGAGITVNVKDNLKAKASSGGDINYYGNPTAVTNNSSRSGNVDKM